MLKLCASRVVRTHTPSALQPGRSQESTGRVRGRQGAQRSALPTKRAIRANGKPGLVGNRVGNHIDCRTIKGNQVFPLIALIALTLPRPQNNSTPVDYFWAAPFSVPKAPSKSSNVLLFLYDSQRCPLASSCPSRVADAPCILRPRARPVSSSGSCWESATKIDAQRNSGCKRVCVRYSACPRSWRGHI